MEKVKKVIKLEDLPNDGIRALLEKFPDGWEDHVKKVNKPNGDFFHAIDVDTKTYSYLVKVDVKVDVSSTMDNLSESLIDEGAEKYAKSDASSDLDNDMEGELEDDDDDDL